MVIRGVQMFMGLAPAGEWAPERPLLQVQTLCGLRLGCDDAFEDGEFSDDDGVRPVQSRPRLRVVAGTAMRGRLLDEVEDLEGMDQCVEGQQSHGSTR